MTTLAFPRQIRSTVDLPRSAVALVLFVWMLFATAVACADDAANRLLRLVGDDVGLCVEVPRLEENLAAARKSEFAQRLKASSLHQAWLDGEESQKLRKSRQSIEKHTGRTIDQLVGDVFGNSIIIAVYSSPTGTAAGVLLTEADSAEVLDNTLASWNSIEPQQTVSREHAGMAYFERTRIPNEGSSARPLYYAKIDRTFALSDHEEMILKVLELAALDRTPGASNAADKIKTHTNILQSVAYQRARQSISPSHCVAAYLNPRAWDSLFPSPETGPPEGQVVGKVWRRIESLAVGVNLEQGCVLETVVHFNSDNTPADWQASLDRMQGSPEFLDKIPTDAVAIFAGRHDISGLTNLVVQRASEEMEQQQWESFRQVSRGLLLGLDLFDDVLPGLKPNWGGYLVPRPSAEQQPEGMTIPLEGLVAFEIDSKPTAEGKASLRDALDNGLNTGMNLVAAWFNTSGSESPAIVRTTEPAGAVVRWIEGIPGYRPSYVLTATHLAFASNPELAKQFLDAPPENAPRHAGFERCRSAYFPQENQISFIDVAALRKLLEAYRAGLVARVADANSISAEDCEARLARLLDVAALVDSAFIAGQIDSSRLRLVIGGVVDDNAEVATSANR